MNLYVCIFYTVPDSAPRIIQSNLILGQAVCIHWSDIQDFHLHGNHKYYQVTAKYKPRNSSTIQVNVTNVTSVTYLWGNLDGNTVYNFTVQACTESACGPSSDIVNIKPSECKSTLIPAACRIVSSISQNPIVYILLHKPFAGNVIRYRDSCGCVITLCKV